MAYLKLDDPDVIDAMRAYLAAFDALEKVTSEADLLEKSEGKSMAGLVLRKRLSDVGLSTGKPVNR